MIVARDAAHARFHQLLNEGRPLPEYLLRHPIYYAGPAETPPGHVIGSFGPTTAQRMDGYLADFMAHGASLVTLAKGNRQPAVTEACRATAVFTSAPSAARPRCWRRRTSWKAKSSTMPTSAWKPSAAFA